MPRDRPKKDPEDINTRRRLEAMLANANAIPGPGPVIHFIGPDGPVEDRLGTTTMGGLHASGVPHLAEPKPTGTGRVVKYKTQLSKEQDEKQRGGA